MWQHFVNLLYQSGHNFLSALGTTGLGWWVQGVIWFVVTETATYLVIWKVRGKAVMMSHLAENFRIGLYVWLIVMGCVYGPIFGWHVVKAIYDDHDGLVKQVKTLHDAPKPVCPECLSAKGSAAPKPRFQIKIFGILPGNNDNGNPMISVLARVSNSGAPSAALADTWALRITTDADSQEHTGVPVNVTADTAPIFCKLGTGKGVKFTREDSLQVKAAHVIEKGGYQDGVLMFDFPELCCAVDLDKEVKTVSVSVEDTDHSRFSKTETEDSLIKHRNPGFVLGAQNFALYPFPKCEGK